MAKITPKTIKPIPQHKNIRALYPSFYIPKVIHKKWIEDNIEGHVMFDAVGDVLMSATARELGYPSTRAYPFDLLREILVERGYKIGEFGLTASMPISPKSQKLGWEMMKKPAIYAVICKSSGNAYIGQSTTPWLRRAVHLYWLKNYWVYNNANVFFGLKSVADDVKKYGADDFYIELLEHDCPKDIKKLHELEAYHISKWPQDKLYNRSKYKSRRGASVVLARADKEMASYLNRMEEIENRLEEINAQLPIEKAIAKQKNIELDNTEGRMGWGNSPTRTEQREKINAPVKRMKLERNALRDEHSALIKTVKALSVTLKKHFSKIKDPWY